MRICCGNRRITKRIIEDIASHIQNEREKKKKKKHQHKQSLSFGIKMPIRLNEIRCCYTHFFFIICFHGKDIELIQYISIAEQTNKKIACKMANEFNASVSQNQRRKKSISQEVLAVYWFYSHFCSSFGTANWNGGQ